MPTGIPKEKPLPTPQAPAPIVASTFEQAKTDQQEAHKSLLDTMRDHYKTEKRVRVKVRSENGDVTVQVNGYTFIVQANVPVDVPESIALLLENAEYI